jgi:hypothetical protein
MTQVFCSSQLGREGKNPFITLAIMAWIMMIFSLLECRFAFVSIALMLNGLVATAMNGFRKQV